MLFFQPCFPAEISALVPCERHDRLQVKVQTQAATPPLLLAAHSLWAASVGWIHLRAAQLLSAFFCAPWLGLAPLNRGSAWAKAGTLLQAGTPAWWEPRICCSSTVLGAQLDPCHTLPVTNQSETHIPCSCTKSPPPASRELVTERSQLSCRGECSH